MSLYMVPDGKWKNRNFGCRILDFMGALADCSDRPVLQPDEVVTVGLRADLNDPSVH